jgi:hypothetical protein
MQTLIKTASGKRIIAIEKASVTMKITRGGDRKG